MEKRLGVIAILLTKNEPVDKLNRLLSEFSDIVLARQGLPLREKGINVISLVVEGTTDSIGALTGKIYYWHSEKQAGRRKPKNDSNIFQKVRLLFSIQKSRF